MGSGSVEPRGSGPGASITGEGTHVFWHPDAHFMFREVASAARRVVDARTRRKKSAPEGRNLNRRRARLDRDDDPASRSTCLVCRSRRTSRPARLRPSPPRRSRRPTSPTGFGSNTPPRRRMDFESPPRRPSTFASGRRGKTRRRRDRRRRTTPTETPTETPTATIPIGVRRIARESPVRRIAAEATDARAALPWGLDFGDFQQALSMGVDALRAVGGLGPFDPIDRDPSTNATEFTFRVVGSLVAEVHDSPLARCLRGKAALLAPALAASRAEDAEEDAELVTERKTRPAPFKRARRDRGKAYDERVAEPRSRGGSRGGVRVGRVHGGRGRGGGRRGEPRARRAIRRRRVFVHVSRRGRNRGDGVVAARGDIARHRRRKHSTNFSRRRRRRSATPRDARARADAPWSNDVRLRVLRAADIAFDLRDVALDVPLAPAPLFRAKYAKIRGPVVVARQMDLGCIEVFG